MLENIPLDNKIQYVQDCIICLNHDLIYKRFSKEYIDIDNNNNYKNLEEMIFCNYPVIEAFNIIIQRYKISKLNTEILKQSIESLYTKKAAKEKLPQDIYEYMLRYITYSNHLILSEYIL